jgi:hypothetical protein
MRGAAWGPHCSFCGTSTGPFAEVEGLFTVLMCTRCRADRRQASPPPLLAHHDPGEPRLKWGCPIEGCGHRVIIPHELEAHTTAEHPGWTATYELLRPYPNQLQRVVYRQVKGPSPGGPRSVRSGLASL